MKKNELVKLIESVKADKDEFVILSSGALVLRGILDEAQDLDIAVTRKGLEQLSKNYELKRKPNGFYTVTNMIECVEDEMIEKREKIGKYYLQDIFDYLDFIENSDREKDKKRVELVKKYINENNYVRKTKVRK